MLNSISDNVWAVVVVVVGSAVAITGAVMNSKELVAFGATVAGYGAAWFQSSKKSADK